MKIDDELLGITPNEREMIEREERAREYVEYCISKRYEKKLYILMVIGGLVLLSLPLFNM